MLRTLTSALALCVVQATNTRCRVITAQRVTELVCWSKMLNKSGKSLTYNILMCQLQGNIICTKKNPARLTQLSLDVGQEFELLDTNKLRAVWVRALQGSTIRCSHYNVFVIKLDGEDTKRVIFRKTDNVAPEFQQLAGYVQPLNDDEDHLVRLDKVNPQPGSEQVCEEHKENPEPELKDDEKDRDSSSDDRIGIHGLKARGVGPSESKTIDSTAIERGGSEPDDNPPVSEPSESGSDRILGKEPPAPTRSRSGSTNSAGSDRLLDETEEFRRRLCENQRA